MWLLFSHQVVSDSLRPHGLQHERLSFPHHLLELAQIKSVIPSNNLILCCIGSIKKKTVLIHIVEIIDCSIKAISGVSYLRIILILLRMISTQLTTRFY